LDRWFEKLIDACVIASNELSLKAALQTLTNELGFDCYAYLNLRPNETYAISNYPPEWQERYLSRLYSTVDPVVTAAKRKMRAFSWTENQSRNLSKETRQFYSEAREFGIRSGVSIPVMSGFGNVAMLTLASNKLERYSEEDFDPVIAAASVAQVHTKFSQQSATATIGHRLIVLKPEERICLKWSAEGKTLEDIAVLEGMKYNNVCFHIKQARKKLDVLSIQQATAVATKMNLI
jgi:LuxR family transcriptional activator of conjugal transfer of Ti plasmids